jgi:hypothetical protein
MTEKPTEKTSQDEISRLTEALAEMEKNITLFSHHKALWLKLGKDRLAVLRQ